MALQRHNSEIASPTGMHVLAFRVMALQRHNSEIASPTGMHVLAFRVMALALALDGRRADLCLDYRAPTEPSRPDATPAQPSPPHKVGEQVFATISEPLVGGLMVQESEHMHAHLVQSPNH